MFKSITKISLIIFILIILSFILLYWQSNIISNTFKDVLNSELEGIAKVEYDELSGNLIENINLKNIRITLNDSSIIKATSINIRYNLISIIFQPYLVKACSIDSLTIEMVDKNYEDDIKENEKFSVDKIATVLDSLIIIDSLLSVFPQLIVNDLKISNASLKIAEDISFKNVNLDMKYAFNSQDLNILIEKFTGEWEEKNLVVSKFNTEIEANRNRLTINKFQLETKNSYIYAKAEYNFSDKNWIIFDLEDSHLDYSEISEFAKYEGVSKGWINTSIKIVGSPNNFSAQLSVNGNTDSYKIDSLKLDLDYKDNILSIITGKVLINKTFLTFNGKISKESSFGKINFKEFNISNLIPDVIQTSLTGNVLFNVEKLDFNHLNGSGEILLINSEIDSVKIDSLRFAVLATDNNFDIIDPSILKFGESSLFKVRGNLNRNLIINAELFTENNELSQLLPALNFETVNGNFDANLTMTGAIADPNLQGYLFLPFIEKDSIQLDTVLLDLKLDKIFSSRKGDAHFSIMKGDISGFELTEAIVNINFDSNKVYFDTLRFANNKNFISLQGLVSQKKDTFDLAINKFNVFYQNYWIVNSDSVLINFYPNEFIINQAFFSAPLEGVLEVRGFWDNKNNDLQIGLYVENIKLDPFQQFIKSDQNISGVLNGEIVLIDPLNSPNIESEVSGELISLNNTSFGNVTMDIEYDNGNIYFRELILDNDETHFYANGDISLKFVEEDGKQTIDIIEGTESNLFVQWENFDLNQYQQILKMKNPVKGTSSGEIEVSGSIKKPEITISMFADSLIYDKYILSDLKLNGNYKDGLIVLDSLSTEINNTYIKGYGSQAIEMDLSEMKFEYANLPLDLYIYSKDDRIEFLGNFLDQVEKISGSYETNIHIAGTPDNPVLDNGYFEIENGNVVLSRVKNPITDLSITVSIKDSILTIENLSAFSKKEKDIWEKGWSYLIGFFRLFKGETTPEGQMLGEGKIDLRDIKHPNIDLKLKMYEYFVDYFVENTQMVVTTNNLHITGRDTIHIDGDIRIEEGKYNVDLDKLRKNIYLASTEINPEKAISWNLEIDIPDNFIIASSSLDLVNNFSLEISGNIRAIQEPNTPNMELTGYVEILSGNYTAFGQNFEIQQGSINFSKPKKINPEIEIYAEKKTGEYTVELLVNGNLERLMQDLQIRDSNGNYLTNLSLYDKLGYISGSGEAGLVNTGEDVINTSVETVLERGAQDLTGLDKVQINDSKGMVNLQSMKLNNGLQDASISIGKYLTNNLYLEYRSQFGSGAIPAPKLSWEPGNQISLAYKINKFWSVESAYAQTLRGNTLINISLGWKTTF